MANWCSPETMASTSLLSPMIRSLPSFLNGMWSISHCMPPRDGGRRKHQGGFSQGNADYSPNAGIKIISPFVSLAETADVPKQLHRALEDALLASHWPSWKRGCRRLQGCSRHSTTSAGQGGARFLRWCAENDRPCILVLARALSHWIPHRP